MIPIIPFAASVYQHLLADESLLCVETAIHWTQVIVGRWVQNVDVSFSSARVFPRGGNAGLRCPVWHSPRPCQNTGSWISADPRGGRGVISSVSKMNLHILSAARYEERHQISTPGLNGFCARCASALLNSYARTWMEVWARPMYACTISHVLAPSQWEHMAEESKHEVIVYFARTPSASLPPASHPLHLSGLCVHSAGFACSTSRLERRPHNISSSAACSHNALFG